MNKWTRSPLLGCIAAALAGYLITEAIPYSNIEAAFRLPISMTLRVVLGVIVGLVYPKQWAGVALCSVIGPVVALIIDSVTREINLLPIALMLHIALVFPVLIGAFAGKMFVSRNSGEGGKQK